MHTRSRGELKPDPGQPGDPPRPGDPILAIVYAVQRESGGWPAPDHMPHGLPRATSLDLPDVAVIEDGTPPPRLCAASTNAPVPMQSEVGKAQDWRDESTIRYGVLLRSDCGPDQDARDGSARGGLAPAAASRVRALLGRGLRCDEATIVAGEEALLLALVDAVQRHDPDFLVAWDARKASLGYAIARATTLGITPPLVRRHLCTWLPHLALYMHALAIKTRADARPYLAF